MKIRYLLSMYSVSPSRIRQHNRCGRNENEVSLSLVEHVWRYLNATVRCQRNMQTSYFPLEIGDTRCGKLEQDRLPWLRKSP